MGDTLNSLISGAANGALSIVGGALLDKLNRRRNMRDWRAMQEYNSPRMQLQRLRDAGLNPATVLSGQSIENTTTPIQPSDLPDAMSKASHSAVGVLNIIIQLLRTTSLQT